MNGTLTDVPGLRVGHATDLQALTGCTVVLCPPATVAAVDVRGGAPGTRETDLLGPHNRVQHANAVVLSGGSAFGLAAADGVMRYLAERGEGYRTATGHTVPIVPAAILFDLMIGTPGVYPDAEMGYQACASASDAPVEQGCVGAGTGAICGAFAGPELATKGGIGSTSMDLGEGLVVAALVAVNAVGDVLDEQGQIMAGLRDPAGGFASTRQAFKTLVHMEMPPSAGSSTVIGIVATNGRLDRSQAGKMAQMAHDGIARAVDPSHTMFDGDTIFTLATGQVPVNPAAIGVFASEVVAAAIRNAMRHAVTLGGVRAWNQ